MKECYFLTSKKSKKARVIFETLTYTLFRRSVEKVPLKRIICGITGLTVLYNLREFLSELIFINGKLMSENETYKIINSCTHLIFAMLIPYAILIFTNFKVFQTLKNLSFEQNNADLRISMFKAKFCIYVVVTFIFCHSFKAIGSQGIYGLYSVLSLHKHHLKCVPLWVESIDAISWLLIVVNSSSTFYVYVWVKKKTLQFPYSKSPKSTDEEEGHFPFVETQVWKHESSKAKNLCALESGIIFVY